jgi:hypothetical protein
MISRYPESTVISRLTAMEFTIILLLLYMYLKEDLCSSRTVPSQSAALTKDLAGRGVLPASEFELGPFPDGALGTNMQTFYLQSAVTALRCTLHYCTAPTSTTASAYCS